MAFTFDEITNAKLGVPGQLLYVPTTVTITQEDGRTGWGSANFYFNEADQSLNAGMANAFDLNMVFSDRTRFTGNADAQGIIITAGQETGVCNVFFTLKTWGNAQYQVKVALSPYYSKIGKHYLGYGPTIGHGSGQALHCLSFNSIISSATII